MSAFLSNTRYVAAWSHELQLAYHHPLWRHDWPVGRWLYYDFLLPGTLLMHSCAQPAGVSAEEAERQGAGVRSNSCQTLSPGPATSARYFFMETHRADRGDAGVTEVLYQGIVAAFEEDRATIAAQWRNVQRAPGRLMLPLHVDTALSRYRRLYATALQSEAAS